MDITEGVPGLPLRLRIQVLGVDNCEPVPNAVVNLWHCDVRGGYSEFGMVAGNPVNAANESWLRGYQMTDAQGKCEFDTIFPGWYPGRATHIHFDAHIGFEPGGPINQSPNPSSTFMSQMYIPNALKTLVYTTVSAYLAKGDNPTGTHNDGIFQSSGSDDLMLMFDDSDFPDSLTADFTIGLDMAGTPVGLEDIRGRSYFQLDQNHPNPFADETTIPFTMKSAGMVTLSVFNAAGELVSQLAHRRLVEGEYSVTFNRHQAGDALPSGTYLFDMKVHHREGRFRQSLKMILA
jgi:hypothetical protein